MAEAVDTIVEGNQQPRSCELSAECGAEDKCIGGDGSTTTNNVAETLDCRKRAAGSSPGKVHSCIRLSICFALEVLQNGCGSSLQWERIFFYCVFVLWKECVANVPDIMLVWIVVK